MVTGSFGRWISGPFVAAGSGNMGEGHQGRPGEYGGEKQYDQQEISPMTILNVIVTYGSEIAVFALLTVGITAIFRRKRIGDSNEMN